MEKKKEPTLKTIDKRIDGLDKRIDTLAEVMVETNKHVTVLAKAVINLTERVEAIPAMIAGAKEEILEEIRPMVRAVDKDAETLVGHEKRISRIEGHLSLTK